MLRLALCFDVVTGPAGLGELGTIWIKWKSRRLKVELKALAVL
jgi:hypothetical protein